MAATRDKNVGRLDVAMNDALAVGGIERVGNLDCQVKKQLGLQRLAGDLVLQGHAIEKLHGDERAPFVIADLVNRADVGMIQRRGGARFPAKTLQRLRILRDFIRQKFERDEAAKVGIFGLVDHAHATAAQLLMMR